jgi:FlaA1/EpsC-like NDP-sugar epimerase
MVNTALKKNVIKYRQILIVSANVFLISIAYIMAFLIRFDFVIDAWNFDMIIRTIPGIILIKGITFYYFGLYSSLWKHVSIDDVWQIIKANIVGTAWFVIFVFFVLGHVGFPRSVFVIDWGICVALISGVRFISRGIKDSLVPRSYYKARKVLIVGAGEAGVMVLNELRKNISCDIVGFIDDDPAKKGMTIRGKKIFGGKDKIREVVDEYGIEEIILAMPSQKGSVIREMVACCKFPDVNLKIVPGMYKILSGELEVKFREVEPEDLLGRETVEIDEKEISSFVKGKAVLVSGAAGSIGAELCRQIALFEPASIVMIDLNENDTYFLELELKSRHPRLKIVVVMGDVRDVGLLRHVFTKNKPEIVFHAAAYKHVPMMEVIPSAAIKNNVIATRNLIYASGHYNVERFVYISTDKAVHPTSIMGITKRIGEMLVSAKNEKSKTKYMAVRFGNVIGSKGSVVPIFKEQIRKGGPVTVTHPDMCRYFMSVTEAVQLVLQAGALGSGGEIFILDMGEQIKIYDLAENIIVLSGFKPHDDIEIKVTGLRPGEKLFEETLHDTEKDLATRNDKIFVTDPGKFEIKRLIKDIKELDSYAKAMDERAIIRKIRSMVPVYDQFGDKI